MEMQKVWSWQESDRLDHILQSDLLGDRKHPKFDQYRMETGSQRKDIFDSVSEKTSCETGKSMFFSEKEMERAGKAG